MGFISLSSVSLSGDMHASVFAYTTASVTSGIPRADTWFYRRSC